MLSESGDVLIQVEQALNCHLELKLREVGERVVEYFSDKVLNEQHVRCCHVLLWRDYRYCRVQRHGNLREKHCLNSLNKKDFA